MTENRSLYSIYEITIRYDDHNCENNYEEFKSLFYGTEEEIDNRINELNKPKFDEIKKYLIDKISIYKERNKKDKEKLDQLIDIRKPELLEESVIQISNNIIINNNAIEKCNSKLKKLNENTYIFTTEGDVYFESHIFHENEFDNFKIEDDSIIII